MTRGLFDGMKVHVQGREALGIGEVALPLHNDSVEVRYYKSPVNLASFECRLRELKRVRVESQTRCFVRREGVVRYGRVVAECEIGPKSSYLIKFPDQETPEMLAEDQFSVRSYLAADDPVGVLAALANETPYFFEHRMNLVREILRQERLSGGFPTFLTSKVEILHHQVEIAARVLRDPTIRYILADEVGLGKTIEAGLILRQLWLDAPDVRILVVVPDALSRQWRDELEGRFELLDAQVVGHLELVGSDRAQQEWGIVVIDEAHRAIAPAGESDTALSMAVTALARRCQHLLLLSATPALHHETAFLALLELLDPMNYSRDDVDGFRVRIGRRAEIGRALLALRNATVPALVRRSAKALAFLLPDDPTVQLLVARGEEGDHGADLQRSLHLHVSENYRLYRRMLRTRRRWLADHHTRFVRKATELVEYDIIDEAYEQVWTLLEEWRTELAARTTGNSSTLGEHAAAYIRIGEAIAAEPDAVDSIVSEVLSRTQATVGERRLLGELVRTLAPDTLVTARLRLLAEVIQRRIARDGPKAKYVVFCPSASVCARVADRLGRLIGRHAIRVADASSSPVDAGDVIAEFATDQARILVADAVAEEGFNLQYARAIVLWDLPWSPMRIEQRLGRLDRIDRTGGLPCIVMATTENDDLALDEAWRRVLSEGFGIYHHPMSDLQHLIDPQLRFLQERAFLGGPGALVEAIGSVKDAVCREREAVEEQDIVDGIHGLGGPSALYSGIQEADSTADNFGRALSAYVRNNLGVRESWDPATNASHFYRSNDTSPLVPVDRLVAMAGLLSEPFTVHRSVAIEDFTLQLMRPGNPGVEACRDLLSWDDRGRAFAVWRPVANLLEVRIVFRCFVHVAVVLAPIGESLDVAGWDPIRRGGLLRLLRGWFPDLMIEMFLDERGMLPAESLVDACRRGYDNRRDVNLGKERAAHVRNAVGSNTWNEWCGTVQKRALDFVSSSPDVTAGRATAVAAAKTHFASVKATLQARKRAHMETAAQVSLATRDETLIEQLVMGALASPAIRLDTIGAYFLSSSQFWSMSDDSRQLA